MLNGMPGGNDHDHLQPVVAGKEEEKHNHQGQNPGVPDEMGNLRVQDADKAVGLRSRDAQHIDLNHLEEMLQQMGTLSDDQHKTKGQPAITAIECGGFKDKERKPGQSNKKRHQPPGPASNKTG